MTTNDSFFQQKQPAAVLKHALLREYAKVFASAVGSRDRSRPVWVVDAYAGAGAYEEADPEGNHPDGSPLILLKMAESFARTQRINSIFIESKAQAASALETNTQAFRERGLDVTVLQGDVENRLPEAWTRIGADPVVTFLDPFGVAMGRGMMTDLLLSRGSGLRPSEVLININLEAVWRIGGTLEERAGVVVPQQGQERGVERLDHFLGGTHWRDAFLRMRQEQGSAARAAQHVIATYREGLRKDTGYDSMSIPVRRRPHHEPLFLLTLFFRHPFGGYKFADAACRATKAWRSTYRQRELTDFLDGQNQDSLFGNNFDIEHSAEEWERHEAVLDAQWVTAICDNVRRLGSVSIEVAPHVRGILGDTLGFAGERHIRKAWDQLASEGYLQRRDKSLKQFHRGVMVRA